MEICEETPVDLELNTRKRQCMEDVSEHPNHKRTCHGLVSITNGNGFLFNQLNDCNMLYWQKQMAPQNNASIQKFVSKSEMQLDSMPFLNSENSATSKACQRCMAGESGHINHILGL